ncbi:methyltransferase [Candidatus Campbellbacteria bacterium]|nr:MAG: methyltransferase [Candidatus Campbellbacteria bacterium]
MKDKFIQDSIGETLLIPLYMKSVESQKENPIITDKTAVELVQKIDYDFSKFDKAINSSVGTAIRANYFDQKTKIFIQNNQKPVVVLVGCGLDSRYERIGEVAKKAIFYQLDIPEVMEIREKLIPKHSNETNIASSMLETKWMDELKEKHQDANFLFVIEGVLMYFNKEDVKSVFQNLASRFSNSEILFDMMNVWMSKNSDKHDVVKLTDARFVYGTDDDKQMEKWADNLKLISVKLFKDFPEWKRLGWRRFIMKLIPQFKKSLRLLHYKIK